MTIKIGMHTGPQNCTYEDLRRLWHIADSSGFHWISIWDHFYDNPSPDGSGPCFEAVSTLMALAAETRNVRVGSLVFCMGFRHPAVLAKAAVTIDHVSNGRLELGLGGGWFEMEYNAFGIPFPPVKNRLDMLDEGVQVIRSMLTQEQTTFSGQHFQLTDAYCSPRPVQQPPRIWIGGGGERRTLRLAARYAGGWNVPYITADRYRHKIEVLDRWCETEGRDPATIARSVNLHFAMGTDEASAKSKREALRGRPQEGGALTGRAQEVIDHIGVFGDAGAQGVNITMRAPFDWDALQAFIEDIMPAFQ